MWNDEDLERGDEQFDQERDLAACSQVEGERDEVKLLQSLPDAEFAGLAAQVARGFVPRHQPAFEKVRHLFPGDALSVGTRRIFMAEVTRRLNGENPAEDDRRAFFACPGCGADLRNEGRHMETCRGKDTR